jgi:hypothetical protein
MAAAVLGAVTSRLRREGRLADGGNGARLPERPPLIQLRSPCGGG